jgi:hypothetical protein
MEGSCEFIKSEVADSGLGVGLQLRSRTGDKQLPTAKNTNNQQVTKRYTGPLTWMDYLERPTQHNGTCISRGGDEECVRSFGRKP